MRTTVRTLLVAALLASGLGIAGCGADERTVSVNGDQVSVDTEAGDASDAARVTAEPEQTMTLPEDFPQVAVPIVEGQIVGGAKNTTDGTTTWSVIVQVQGDVDSVLAVVTRQLKDAGYAGESASNLDGNGVAQFHGPYTVGVSINEGAADDPAGSGVAVTYVVSPSRPR